MIGGLGRIHQVELGGWDGWDEYYGWGLYSRVERLPCVFLIPIWHGETLTLLS